MRDKELSEHLAHVSDMHGLVDRIGCALQDATDAADAARLCRLLHSAERFYLGAIPAALERSRDVGPEGEVARAFLQAAPTLLEMISRAGAGRPVLPAPARLESAPATQSLEPRLMAKAG